MARTPRCRRIHCYPDYWSFAPQGVEYAEVDALICGGIGVGAQMALAEAGIRLYAGVQGSDDEAAEALAAGTLEYDPDARCDHHVHHGDGCGHDHCAEHHCRGN